MTPDPRHELNAKAQAWAERRRRLWGEFLASLTPEQRALYDAHEQAAAWRRKIYRKSARGLPASAGR